MNGGLDKDGDGGMAAGADAAFIPTRRSLLSRLRNWDDQASWRDFFNTYWKLIYSVARKAGLSDAEAQDVVQDTVVTVAKRIGQLKYDPALGSFKGWLLNTTRWRIYDLLRKREAGNPPRRDEGDAGHPTATADRVPDPASMDLDSMWDQDWEQNLMDAALARARAKASPRQYQLFDLYVVKGWPPKKVAATMGVSANQVYIARHRVGALIRRELAALRKRFA